MKIISPIFLVTLIFTSQLNITAAESENITLTVEVTGAQPSTGHTILSLFSTPDNYLKKPLKEMTLPVDPNGTALFKISDLEAGIYAVNVVYDADMDGKLNTGLFGIPTELVGFSNNVVGRFGPPSFERTSFSLNQSERIRIRLGSAKGE